LKQYQDKFSAFIEKSFWLLLTGIAAYGVTSLSKISDSTVSLNEKMGFVIEKIKLHDDELKQHDREIIELQMSRKRH